MAVRIPLIDSRGGARFWLIVILLAALAGRMGWIISRPTDDATLQALPDQVEYLTLAQNLRAGHGLVFYDDRFADNVYAYRTPGYPLFVAAFGANVPVVRAAQAVLDASTAWAAGLLALAVLPGHLARRGMLLAALAVALNPLLVYFCGLLLSETLFTAQLAWGMVLLVAGGQGGRLRVEPTGSPAHADPASPERPWTGTLLWLAGGALLATTGLVRPSAAPLAVLMGVAAALACRPTRASGRPAFRPRWPLPVATTMLLLTAAALVPWGYRNKQLLGDWILTTTNGGATLWDGFNPDATGASDQARLKKMPQLQYLDERSRSHYLEQRARTFIAENPRRAVDLAVAKAARTWSPVPLSADYGTWRNRLIAGAYAIPLFLLALLGLWRSEIGGFRKAFLVLPAVYFTLVHMASVGSIRYRVPVEPALAVLAVAGLLSLRGPTFSWRRAGGLDAGQ